MALAGDADGVYDGLRELGFVKSDLVLNPDAVLDYVQPMLEPIAAPTFHFTRGWLRHEAARIADPRSPANSLGRQLNLPPAYLLIHRVTLGGIGVLCQLDAEAPFRSEMERWVRGFSDAYIGDRYAAEPPAELPTPGPDPPSRTTSDSPSHHQSLSSFPSMLRMLSRVHLLA